MRSVWRGRGLIRSLVRVSLWLGVATMAAATSAGAVEQVASTGTASPRDPLGDLANGAASGASADPTATDAVAASAPATPTGVKSLASLREPFELPPWHITLGGVAVLALGLWSGWRLGRRRR